MFSLKHKVEVRIPIVVRRIFQDVEFGDPRLLYHMSKAMIVELDSRSPVLSAEINVQNYTS